MQGERLVPQLVLIPEDYLYQIRGGKTGSPAKPTRRTESKCVLILHECANTQGDTLSDDEYTYTPMTESERIDLSYRERTLKGEYEYEPMKDSDRVDLSYRTYSEPARFVLQ